MRTAYAASLAALLGAAAVGGCGGSDEPVEGSIRVTVTTEGQASDPDGYTLSLDGGPATPIDANATVTLDGLATGNRTLRMAGLADNCTVSGAAERTVRVEAGATVSEDFVVVCPALAGAIRVTTSTSGEVDLDGYLLTVGPVAQHRVPASGAVRLTGIDEGRHAIALSDIAPNCTASPSNPATVDVVAAQTASISLAFSCTQVTGSVRVTTTTTGLMIPTGYHVVVNGAGEWLPLGVNDTLIVPRLLPGENVVRLEGVASNCTAEGGVSRTASVTLGATTDVAFAVNCVAVGDVVLLTVKTATSGTDPDPDGYLIKLQGNLIADSALASPNGSVTFIVTKVNQHHPSDYYLNIEGVAPNCVADQPLREGMVGSSDITETFAINCTPVRQLAAVIGQGSSAEIYRINSNGTGATALTSNTALDDDPAWSPDGSRIVFTSERDGDREIYVMDANGSNPVRITNSAGVDERPAWAPDGNRIAFVSKRDGNAEIYVMKADGTGQTRLTASPSEDTDPAWSPDGGKIAFASSRSGVPNIHVMNADGSTPVQLSFYLQGAAGSQPTWAPDGSAIAWVLNVPGQYSSLVWMAPDGSSGDNVGAAYGATRLADPAWSPDGGQIAVTLARCAVVTVCQYDVVVFPNVSYGTVGAGLFRMLRPNTRNAAWRP